ncbi:MAG: class I SAM-dependent methyltransferase [Acidimicrobiales bacterium]
MESAVLLIRHVCDLLGLTDLSTTDVLDVGCGTRFTQAFLDHGLPIESYVGVDVDREMVELLRENVSDPRFEYHHIDVRNERYNPDAPPMTEHTDLGVGERRFDVILLFSVFTHLAPHDYSTMLRLLRRYVRPDGRLVYTLFIDELTQGGFGFIDRVERGLRAADDTGAATPRERHAHPFVDVHPDQPLLCALYSREHAYELIDGTGWRSVELLPPNELAQHHFVCAPEPSRVEET